MTSHSKYLGLLVLFGRSKKEIFSVVQERVWKKIKGWKEKCLSRAGKETLIKLVAQTILTYITSCYKLPENCCDQIESLLSKFWWGSIDQKKKLHWVSWERMGTIKNKGRLGFRSFRLFNKALLAKQCWRLVNDEYSLMAKKFKSRYFPRTTFLVASVGYQPSYAWRSLMHAKDVISKGARWLIGDGQQVQIWKDSWIPTLPDFKLTRNTSDIPAVALVEDLIDADTKNWNRGLIIKSFIPFEAQLILNISISLRLPNDKLIRHWERDGSFSVISAHHMLKEEESKSIPESSDRGQQQLWTRIWKVSIPNCVKNFLWRLGRNILPTRCNLAKKGIHLDVLCPICHTEAETGEHIFMSCPLVKLV